MALVCEFSICFYSKGKDLMISQPLPPFRGCLWSPLLYGYEMAVKERLKWEKQLSQVIDLDILFRKDMEGQSKPCSAFS